uniref:Interferon regulatory factor-3 domain-containing protein n=1 Tax=Naja naja TaxID=35670 RepID=A0A8C6VNC5_NAJNA
MNSPLEQLITTPFGKFPESSGNNKFSIVTLENPWPYRIWISFFLETAFEVRAFYRGRQVLHKVINKVNPRGLCFVPPGVRGNYLDLADVSLPDPTILNDKRQAEYTLRLLKGVSPGVVLRIEGNQLCGMRTGTCHVYWSQSEIPGDGIRHGNLLKEQFVPIFNLQHFISDLIGYMEGRNGCPNYNWWLCFGEEWPDSNCVWKKKLIMVQVSSCPKVWHMIIPLELKVSHHLSGKEELFLYLAIYCLLLTDSVI